MSAIRRRSSPCSGWAARFGRRPRRSCRTIPGCRTGAAAARRGASPRCLRRPRAERGVRRARRGADGLYRRRGLGRGGGARHRPRAVGAAGPRLLLRPGDGERPARPLRVGGDGGGGHATARPARRYRHAQRLRTRAPVRRRPAAGAAEALDACRALSERGPRAVIATSLETAGGIGALARSPDGAWLVETLRLPAVGAGAGDLTAALLLDRLLAGAPLAAALSRAVSAV